VQTVPVYRRKPDTTAGTSAGSSDMQEVKENGCGFEHDFVV